MAKGYWIVHLSVDDAEAYRPYVEKAPEVLAALGGRYLARGGQSETREGDMPHGRHVILEFPSYAEAVAAYESESYREILGIRRGATHGTLTIVEGL